MSAEQGTGQPGQQALRQVSYLATLQLLWEEYNEVAAEAKKIGIRLSGLRRAIDGLSILTDKQGVDKHELIIISTPESRAKDFAFQSARTVGKTYNPDKYKPIPVMPPPLPKPNQPKKEGFPFSQEDK